jgi:hypothetical protein
MPPAVVCDLWDVPSTNGCHCFTTVGNWKQPWRDVTFQGELYRWSKHFEYLKFLDLPRQVDQEFELALASYEPKDRQMLEEHGWRIRDAMSFSTDLDAYRQFVADSRGEFTVAKDQNVRLRSGWFSERSAQYLAAGKPVITQDTGFGSMLPTREGLFGFSTMDEIVQAVEEINADYARHCRRANEIACEFFDYNKVLPPMLRDLDV